MDRAKSKENKDETSNEKFKRLSEKRVTNLLRSLEILGNLSNTSNYKYEVNIKYLTTHTPPSQTIDHIYCKGKQ